MRPLVDQPSRDAVRHALGENLFVDASAGTGKTTELVERIVELYRGGTVQAGRMAAITFTDAAAAELRHRVRARLELCVAEPDGDPHGRLAQALAAMDDAAFTTLHGFAQRLLAEHPLEAGLPPVFELLTDVDETIEFERRWDGFLSALVEDPAASELLGRAIDLGVKQSALCDLAEALHDGHDRAGGLVADVTVPVPDAGGLMATLDETLLLRDRCPVRDDKLLLHLDDVVAPLLAALRQATTADEIVRCLAATPTLSTKLGNAGNWRGCKPQVAELLIRANEQLCEQLTAQRDAVARALTARIAAFVRDWAAERRRAGRLRFHDLLVLSRTLLTESQPVRTALRERYPVLLLDEFQDTDPLQIEIAVLLGGLDHAAESWEQARLRTGRLFVVGDPKQSIYRFRRADIAVYERAKRMLGMREVTLTQNFRSVPGIVDWVNTAFCTLLGKGELDAQPAYAPLVAERAAGSAPAPVRIFGSDWEDNAAQVREREAVDVARAVRQVLDDGWEVTDPRSGETRGVRRRDIAILVRRHATVRLLERTLGDAGLPYRIESKSLIYATDEVRDLITILTAIDDPSDQVAVVATLRHAALGCDDRALVEWKAQDGGWDYRADPPPGVPADHPVAAATLRLRRLHEQRWSFSVGGLVEHVTAQLRLLELGFARSRPRDHWRRLRFLADQAHAFHDAGGHLRGFLRWARRQEEQDVRVDEFVVDEADDDAVRITTIHGAKGLEYPIVVLLGLDGDTNRLPTNPRVLWDGAGAELSLGGTLCTAGWTEARNRERDMHALEEMRLLYVGATRARDHLLISLHHRREARSCHAKALREIPALDELWEPLPLAPVDPVPVVAQPGSSGTARGPEDLAAWRAERSALSARARRPGAIAATTIAGELGATAQAAQEPDELLVEEIPARKGRGGTSFGRAVHAVLQTAELADPANLDDLARAQAAVEGVPREAREVARAAATALQSATVRAAVASGRYWREYYVGATIESVVVEGFCDLLFEDEHGLVVADYKTDRLEGRTAEQAAARYRPQAATYALALEAALGRPVGRCVFVFTRASGADEVEVSGAALEAAKDDVRALLRGRHAGGGQENVSQVLMSPLS